MKKIFAITTLSLSLLACGGGNKSAEEIISAGNLEAIKQKRTEIVSQQKGLNASLSLLDNAIAKLDPNQRLPLVTTILTKEAPFTHFVELQGSVDTKNLLELAPESNGILSRVYVKEGQKVRKGQLLAKIDDGGLSQQLSQLKIQAALAKTTFERQERLWNQNIGSEIQFLQAKSNYEAQEQAINQVKKQIAKTNVTAPFSGTIDEIITEQGSVVAAGQSKLMRIVNLDNMHIDTDVPERYISAITPGKTVVVTFPVLGKTIDATVKQTGSYINPDNRTFKVEIAIPNKDKDIKPNLTAKLRINDYSSDAAILIPQSIISENAKGQQYVYAVSKTDANNIGEVSQKIITTGKTQGDNIEVLSGLSNADALVQEGARSIKAGQKVKVKNN